MQVAVNLTPDCRSTVDRPVVAAAAPENPPQEIGEKIVGRAPVVGTGVGAILGRVSGRPVQPLLFQIEPNDPVVMIAVPLVLAALAALAVGC